MRTHLPLLIANVAAVLCERVPATTIAQAKPAIALPGTIGLVHEPGDRR